MAGRSNGAAIEPPSSASAVVGVPIGVPVGRVVPALSVAIGIWRWRIFWTMVWLLNLAWLPLAWLLNWCAPFTLEWLECTGPIYSFHLTPDVLSVRRSVDMCGVLPLPWWPFGEVERLPPADVHGVYVYSEVVLVSVLMMGGGATAGSPVMLPSVDEANTEVLEERASVNSLPEWMRCMTQPCAARCTGAERDHTKRIFDYRRYYLGAEVAADGRDGGRRFRVIRLSRTALSKQTTEELFGARDHLRERLHEMDHAREGVASRPLPQLSMPQSTEALQA